MNTVESTALAEASDLASGSQNHIDLTCPMCNQPRMHHILAMNALSRRDNTTYICTTCGQREALEDWMHSHNADARNRDNR